MRGLPELREAIAVRFTEPRPADERRTSVLVTSGAQQALALVIALLVGRGEGVIVDDVSYPNLLDLVTLNGARHAPITPDEDGPVPARMRDAAQATGARLAYLVPTHHNPLGTVVPDRRRAALARLAQDEGLMAIDDETVAELPITGEVPAPLAAFGPKAPIITVGSLSKLVWGGLRVGWVRADTDTVARLSRFRAVADLGSPAADAGGRRVAVRRGHGPLRRRPPHAARPQQLAFAEEAARRSALPDWTWRRRDGGP